MTTGRKSLINDDLLLLVEEAARARNREPSDVVGEAVRKANEGLNLQSEKDFMRLATRT